jgi:hypothetical protein
MASLWSQQDDQGVPLILNWGVWLAKKCLHIFRTISPPQKEFLKVLGILSHYPQEKRVSPIWPIQEITVDSSYPVGLFRWCLAK